MRSIVLLLMAALLLSVCSPSIVLGGDRPAFPGAEGFGSTTPGGRGGRVIFVNNLKDSGLGSFRAACETQGPRIVVFRTGGTIVLSKSIKLTHPYITIAGQSAPSGGICIRNDPSNEYSPLVITTHNVIIRHLRIRPGPPKKPSPCVDGVGIEHGAWNVILDHCSLSWSTDETFQLWGDPHDITLQWSFVTEALHHSTHPLGAHSKGVLIGTKGCTRISIHHCLLAHNIDRNPRIGMEGILDFVNNVIYNPDAMGQLTDDHGKQLLNYVGNYIKRGPNSRTEPPSEKWSRYELFAREKADFGFSIYVKGNLGPHRPSEDIQESAVVDPRDRKYITGTRHKAPPVTTMSARNALKTVLARAGATLPKRDAVDNRIVDEVRRGTGRVIDDPSQVGGWPKLERGTPPVDSDLDGMPDTWEKIHSFNPDNPSDNNRDVDGDGYTNIEEYLNGTDPRRAERSYTSRPAGVK
ncbi:MAG: pectate lyase [Planctomycetota bacterium]|nr:MAG: pectate lyase [Planctomycetota bacterium]